MVVAKRLLGSNLSLVAGYVEKYAEGIGNALGKVVNLRIDGVDIAFWNSTEGGLQMANIIRSAKVSVGSFISCSCVFKDTTYKKARGVGFKFNGVWTFSEKMPVASKQGIIMNTERNEEKFIITLDNDEKVTFNNLAKGYHYADRIAAKAVIGSEIEIAEQNGEVTNFRVGDGKWEIRRSLSAIVGKVAFVDEGETNTGVPFVRINISVYKGKDINGNSKYENVYAYFDDSRSSGMISQCKKLMKRGEIVVVVGTKNEHSGTHDAYSGYFFNIIK